MPPREGAPLKYLRVNIEKLTRTNCGLDSSMEMASCILFALSVAYKAKVHGRGQGSWIIRNVSIARYCRPALPRL